MYTVKVRLGAAFVAALLSLGLLGVVAAPARAATVAELQAQIAKLLTILAALQAQVNALDDGDDARPSTVACPNITRSLYVGLTDGGTNGEVTLLQKFLGIEATGYFGSLTEAKVKEWQAKKGIVSSGTAGTTGYGVVGEKTRALMRAGCTVASDDADDEEEKSCTLKVDNRHPDIGERYRVSWSTKNIDNPVMIEYRAAGGEVEIGRSGSRTFVADGKYADVSFYISEGFENTERPLCSVDLSVEPGAAEGDLRSRTMESTSDRPTLSGTASGVWTVGISLGSTSGDKEYGSGEIDVENGKWSHQVDKDLAPGRYTVTLWAYDGDDEEEDILDTGTLTIFGEPEIDLFRIENFSGKAGAKGTFVWESEGSESCGIWSEATAGGARTVVDDSLPAVGSHTATIDASNYVLRCVGYMEDGDDEDSFAEEEDLRVSIRN